MGSSLFLLDLLTGHEPALAPERELSQLAALRQATRLSRFSARANIRAPACGVLKRGGSWEEGLNLLRGARFIFYGLIWFDLVRLAPKDIGSGIWLY
jgi:hypothetical protein